jgi:NTP pyrophosphatase (non-canonical NTP hydrolase)
MVMSMWIPETNQKVLRRVGKTGEECAELSKVCSRITIQGLDGVDPATGESNRRALAKEVADVMAQCLETIDALDLPLGFIEERAAIKRKQMAEWEALFNQAPQGA